MGDLFVTSDIHFGHKNILKYCANSRPFSTFEEMDNTIVENWNKKVTKNDIVYILGDISFTSPYRTVGLLNRLNGKLKLVGGNHDTYKYTRYDTFRQRFEWMKIYNSEVINKKYIVMFHFPMIEWDRMFHGSYHFHGHLHSQNPLTLDCRRWDVGLDGSPDFAPYEINTLISEIDERYKNENL